MVVCTVIALAMSIEVIKVPVDAKGPYTETIYLRFDACKNEEIREKRLGQL
jgi:hypothetical protein